MKTKPTLTGGKRFSLPLIAFAVIASNGVSAQNNNVSPVTLSVNNYIVPPLIDYFMQGANAAGVPIPRAGRNQTWDYSVLEKNDAYNIMQSYHRVENPVFQSARRENNFVFELGGIIALQETGYESVDNNSFHRAGRSVDLQKFPLQILTGVSTDSLIINKQDAFDNEDFAFLSYPCTVSSSWSSNVRDITGFQLSVQAFDYDHSRGEFVQIQTLTRKVIGSGKMRIPAVGGKSPYIPVLMIQSVLTTIDSVYINDEPAPDALLAAFGLAQGQEISENTYIFLREGIDEPLITFNMDPSFSTITTIQYDTKYADIYCGNKERLCVNGSEKCVAYPLVTPVLLQSDQATIGACDNPFLTKSNISPSNISAMTPHNVKAAPNPFQDRLTLYLNNLERQIVTLRVSDLTGRVLLQLKTSSQQITFGDQLRSGVYYAEVMKSNKKETIQLIKL